MSADLMCNLIAHLLDVTKRAEWVWGDKDSMTINVRRARGRWEHPMLYLMTSPDHVVRDMYVGDWTMGVTIDKAAFARSIGFVSGWVPAGVEA